ncbi:hypothetical protein Mapa_015674 [Marchantia paleacea]|nr:hypothetical protein Mapa_015674 [Marchantia paleacea]
MQLSPVKLFALQAANVKKLIIFSRRKHADPLNSLMDLVLCLNGNQFIEVFTISEYTVAVGKANINCRQVIHDSDADGTSSDKV